MEVIGGKCSVLCLDVKYEVTQEAERDRKCALGLQKSLRPLRYTQKGEHVRKRN